MDSNSWALEELRVRRVRFGDDQGKYKGDISFKNEDEESFKFNLDDPQTQVFLSLIAGQVCRSADELGKRISESISSSSNVEM